jgi:Flp pilus assembly protein TadD
MVWRNTVVLLTLFVISPTSFLASPGNAALDAARTDYALHFFSIEAHVRMAKALYDQGERLQAFYILETARREHFSQEEFDRAFRQIFRREKFDNSSAAEDVLQHRLAQSPNDFRALIRLADIYISRSDFGKAEPLLEQAGRIRPNEYSPVEALTEIYRRTNRESQARSTEWLWLNAHPGSVESYATEIERASPQKGLVVVDEALKRYPDSAVLHYDHGALLHQANDLQGAEREFARAAELAPDSALIQGWMARFYLKSKQDLPRAFDHYIRAYFLDPDFYDTEYAESRIRKLANQLSQAALEKGLPQDGKPDPLLDELSPAVMDLVLEALKAEWDPDALPTVVGLLHEDDEQNRWNAMQLIATHADASFDAQLSPLLEDPDLPARGMAAYIAVIRWHERAFPIIQKWFEHPAALIRFDAISALAMEGGNTGRQMVQRYLESGNEPDEHLRKIIPKILAEQQIKPAPAQSKPR